MKAEGKKDRKQENKEDDEAETYRWRKRGGRYISTVMTILSALSAVCICE